jgi:transposase/DNA-binding Xre family transcriptional regulator
VSFFVGDIDKKACFNDISTKGMEENQYSVRYREKLATEVELTSIDAVAQKYNVSPEWIQKWHMDLFEGGGIVSKGRRRKGEVHVYDLKDEKYHEEKEVIREWILEEVSPGKLRIDVAIDRVDSGVAYWFRVKSWALKNTKILFWNNIDVLLEMNDYEAVIPRMIEKIKKIKKRGDGLEAKLGIHKSSLTRIIKGQKDRFMVTNVIEMCKALDIDIFYKKRGVP